MWRLLGPIAMLVLMACSARCPLPPASHPPELSHPADPELAQRIAERSRAFELAHRAAHEEACAANHAAKLRCIEAVEARRNAMHALAGEARVLLRLEVPAAYYALEEQLDECGRGWWVAYPRATEPDGAAELDAALLLDARRRLPALVDAHAHHLESLRGSDPVYRADRLAALGDAALRLRRLDIAEARYREALEQSQGLPWLVRRGEAGLSVVASQRRQHEQAADHRRRALAVSLEVRQAVWVRNDERAVRSYSIANSAGASRLSTGEQSLFSPQSDNVFSTTLEANRARYGEGHPIVASDRVLLGQVLGLADRPEASREAIEQALRELADAYGPAHRSLIGPLRSLASLDTRQGRPRRAIRLLERAIAIATPYGRDGRASAGRSRLALGRLLAERGQTQSALAVLRQARNDLDAGFDQDESQISVRLELSDALLDVGDLATSAAMLDEARQLLEHIPNLDVWVRIAVGEQLRRNDRSDAALEVLTIAIEESSVRGPRRNGLAEGAACFARAEVQRERGAATEFEADLERALELLRTHAPEDHPIRQAAESLRDQVTF